MVKVVITPFSQLSPSTSQVEIVERKGLGHPDTICDALAEEISLALSRYYRDQFGLVLHHNVDKALLWGGRSQPAFGGGKILEPMEIFLAGRATREYKGVPIPVDEIVVETSQAWLKNNLHALDSKRDVKLHCMIRPGSSDLIDLYLRQEKTGIAMANDTSCGVGYAPLDELETLVLAVEQHLNSKPVKDMHPEIGEDIKVMGVRQGTQVSLTIACAFIDKYIADMGDYHAKKDNVLQLARQACSSITDEAISLQINTADSKESSGIYLTVTGTSAEAGDDGEVGRGNRVNGIITPYRPMNMEAAAGKNPVTHVGKLYNIVAQQICSEIIKSVPTIQQAQCYLVSRIGSPVNEPQVVDLRIQGTEAELSKKMQQDLRDIVTSQLNAIHTIQHQLIERAIKVY